MDKSQMMDAWEQRKSSYANHWKVGLCSAPCADLPCCCLSLCCPYCASYALRKRTLYNDMSRYRCCGGFLPCSGRCGESSAPQCCLCLEVCCCFGTSVAVTRWMIQDELRIQNSTCDNCILATMLFLQQLACICRLAACLTGDETLGNLADIISFIAEVMWWTVCACLQTQHKVQLDERDVQGTGGGYPAPATMQPPVPYASPQYGSPPGAYPASSPPNYPSPYPPSPGYPDPRYGYQQHPPPPPAGYPQAPMYDR